MILPGERLMELGQEISRGDLIPTEEERAAARIILATQEIDREIRAEAEKHAATSPIFKAFLFVSTILDLPPIHERAETREHLKEEFSRFLRVIAS
jgi:hypothetical protein